MSVLFYHIIVTLRILVLHTTCTHSSFFLCSPHIQVNSIYFEIKYNTYISAYLKDSYGKRSHMFYITSMYWNKRTHLIEMCKNQRETKQKLLLETKRRKNNGKETEIFILLYLFQLHYFILFKMLIWLFTCIMITVIMTIMVINIY